MANNEKEGEWTSSHGVDWEVVSLTSSAYAAAPCPKQFDPADESKEKDRSTERESSSALFKSGHFVFPPSEHEHLPIEPDLSKIYTKLEGHGISPSKEKKDKGSDNPDKSSDNLLEVEFVDEGSTGSIQDIGFKDDEGFQSLNLVLEEQAMLADLEFTSLHTGASRSGTVCELEQPSQENQDSPGKSARENEDEFDGSGLPCETWWKRHAMSLFHHVKEGDMVWPIVLAAAVMGLVIMGHRWQREKWSFIKLNGTLASLMRG